MKPRGGGLGERPGRAAPAGRTQAHSAGVPYRGPAGPGSPELPFSRETCGWTGGMSRKEDWAEHSSRDGVMKKYEAK